MGANKGNIWGNLKAASGWISTVSVLLGLFYFGQYLEKKDSKIREVQELAFPDQPTKYSVINHVTEGLTPEQQQRQYFRDSMNAVNAMKSRKLRDSLWKEMRKDQQTQDTINLRNADQLYQIKEILKQQGHSFNN